MQTKSLLLASFLLASLALPLSSCGGSKAQREHTETTEEPRRAPQPFDADSAYSYVASHVAFGPRVHLLCLMDRGQAQKLGLRGDTTNL